MTGGIKRVDSPNLSILSLPLGHAKWAASQPMDQPSPPRPALFLNFMLILGPFQSKQLLAKLRVTHPIGRAPLHRSTFIQPAGADLPGPCAGLRLLPRSDLMEAIQRFAARPQHHNTQRYD